MYYDLKLQGGGIHRFKEHLAKWPGYSVLLQPYCTDVRDDQGMLVVNIYFTSVSFLHRCPVSVSATTSPSPQTLSARGPGRRPPCLSTPLARSTTTLYRPSLRSPKRHSHPRPCRPRLPRHPWPRWSRLPRRPRPRPFRPLLPRCLRCPQTERVLRPPPWAASRTSTHLTSTPPPSSTSQTPFTTSGSASTSSTLLLYLCRSHGLMTPPLCCSQCLPSSLCKLPRRLTSSSARIPR
jgi:hypothetical protein